ncbi:MAG: T9SS type A sorting domain-containing protein, partial [Bacteroidales bacterium]
IGLSDHNVSSLAINSGGHIFAGTYEGGVFRSTDNGENWTPINAGLTNPMVSSLGVSPSGHIFAGTTGSGVFRSVLSTTSVKENSEMPFSCELSQNYPNPFNSSTTLGYSLHKPGNVVLKIYDMLGNELQTLINEFHTPGEYTIIFNAQSLSNGIYFYKLQVDGGLEQTRKMILIR